MPCAVRKRAAPSEEFLTWFIGFTEGDGSFIITRRVARPHTEDLQFVITQKEISVLEMIRDTFGFGRVIQQGQRTHRDIMQDKKALELLVALFNGNLVLPTKQRNFKKFVELYNQKAGTGRIRLEKVQPIQSEILPSLDNAWLSGFTDSEGCFTICFLSNSNAFRLRYLVSQNSQINLVILKHLIRLFKTGAIEPHSKKKHFAFIVNGIKACALVRPYFDKFPLKTQKNYSYLLWKQIQDHIRNKHHLDPTYRPYLRQLAARVNSQRRALAQCQSTASGP